MCAQAGHLQLLKWARAYNCYWNIKVPYVAAEHGHKEVLKYLREYDCPWFNDLCTAACAGGQLDLMPWLKMEFDCFFDPTLALPVAAQHGHLNILMWAHELGLVQTHAQHIIRNATIGGSLNVLLWALKEGIPLGSAASGAAYTCNIEVLEFLDTIGIKVRNPLPAAQTGNLEVLRWIVANNAYFDPDTFQNIAQTAVRYGQLEILDYLETSNFWKVSSPLCVVDAIPSSLMWLVDRGIIFGIAETLQILSTCDSDLLLWLLDHEALTFPDSPTTKFHRRGPSIVRLLALKWRLDLVKWAIESQFEWRFPEIWEIIHTGRGPLPTRHEGELEVNLCSAQQYDSLDREEMEWFLQNKFLEQYPEEAESLHWWLAEQRSVPTLRESRAPQQNIRTEEKTFCNIS